MLSVLPRRFYQRHTLTVARDLLGCFLVRRVGRRTIRARIVETESYHGEDDLACHASRGRTKRTETMYGEAGRAYVYLIYGMYHCLNIVTGPKNFPAAVLIRAVEVEDVSSKETDGPGKLCRFLRVTRTENGHDMTLARKLWIERGSIGASETVVATPRIGVDYAKHSKDWPWRFILRAKD